MDTQKSIMSLIAGYLIIWANPNADAQGKVYIPFL